MAGFLGKRGWRHSGIEFFFGLPYGFQFLYNLENYYCLFLFFSPLRVGRMRMVIVLQFTCFNVYLLGLVVRKQDTLPSAVKFWLY